MDRLALDGLVSGFPTSEIVEQLMEVESLPLKRIEEKSEEATELRDAWRDVNTRLSSLDQTIDPLRLRSNFNQRSVTSSNENIATASASTEAELTDYAIDVIQLAESHQIEVTLGEEGEALDDGQITINDVQIDIEEGDSLETIRDKINNKSGVQEDPEWTTVEGTDDNLQALLLENEHEIDEVNIQFASEAEENLAVEGELENGTLDLTITLEEDIEGEIVTTIQELVDGIESLDSIDGFDFGEVEDADTLGQLGVLAFDFEDGEYTLSDIPEEETDLSDPFSQEHTGTEARIIGDSLLLSAIETGEENEIAFDYDVGLGLNVNEDFRPPQDAVMTIEGVTIDSPTNTIEDAVEGMTFEIMEEGQTNISVGIDSETPAQALEAFAEQYNSTMDFIRTKLDYDEDTEQAGKLQGDTTLMRIENQIRRQLTQMIPTDSEFNRLVAPSVQTETGPLSFESSIGLELDEDGHMTFNRAAFEQAHQKDPDAVTKLLAAREETDDFDGAAISLRHYMEDILRHTVGVIPRQVLNQEQTIQNLQGRKHAIEDRLERTQQRYYRQFTAMEQALSEMMSQQEWLTGQIDNLGEWG